MNISKETTKKVFITIGILIASALVILLLTK
jgi:hypothetical protein